MRSSDTHRFLHFCPDLDRESDVVCLDGDEHHHLSRVLRMSPGESTWVTNGRGLLVECEITAVEGPRSLMSVRGIVEDQPSPRAITVALACIRKDAFAQAVKICTELGATRFQPWHAERSQVPAYGSSYKERLERIALAAIKQSFRSTLPAFAPCASLPEMLDGVKPGTHLVVGDRSGKTPVRPPDPTDVTVVVGPEAGLAPAELAVLGARGARVVSVSAHRLRSETAAAAMMAVLLAPAGAD